MAESESNQSHLEDCSLARDVVAGRPGARQVFAERMRCAPRILFVLNQRMGRPLKPDELEDLAQEIMLIVWRKLPSFEGRSALESWVYRFCHLELLNEVRRRRREPCSIEELTFEAEPKGTEQAASSTAEERDEVQRVSACMQHLPARESEVLSLRFLGQQDFGEIAAGLGISASSVKTHFYRGLAKLRDMLNPRTEETLDG